MSSIDCWEPPGEERLNGWVQGWDRGLHCGFGVGVRTPSPLWKLFLNRGSRLSPWLLFSGQGERGREDMHHWSCTEAWRGHRVMPHKHTYTHPHRDAHTITIYKGLPTSQIASQSGSQSCSSRHLSWQANSQSKGALGLYLVQAHTNTLTH